MNNFQNKLHNPIKNIIILSNRIKKIVWVKFILKVWLSNLAKLIFVDYYPSMAWLYEPGRYFQNPVEKEQICLLDLKYTSKK